SQAGVGGVEEDAVVVVVEGIVVEGQRVALQPDAGEILALVAVLVVGAGQFNVIDGGVAAVDDPDRLVAVGGPAREVDVGAAAADAFDRQVVPRPQAGVAVVIAVGGDVDRVAVVGRGGGLAGQGVHLPRPHGQDRRRRAVLQAFE